MNTPRATPFITEIPERAETANKPEREVVIFRWRSEEEDRIARGEEEVTQPENNPKNTLNSQ